MKGTSMITLAAVALLWACGSGSQGSTASGDDGGGSGSSSGGSSGSSSGGTFGTPVTLASGLDNPGAIAVDSSNLYFLTQGAGMTPTSQKLMKVPLSGGTPTTLATGTFGQDIALDATTIYWTDASNGIKSIPKSGGQETLLVGTDLSPWGIAVDDTTIYWANANWNYQGPGSIVSVPKAGGTPNTLASNLPSPQEVAIDASDVYFGLQGTTAKSYSDGAIAKVPLAGGSVTTLVSNRLEPTGLKIYGGSVYWAEQDGIVASVPVGGGAVTTLATRQPIPWGMAVDASGVYLTAWSNSDVGDEPISVVPLAGGTASTIARGNAPYGITTDTANVYWTDYGPFGCTGNCVGAVMKVAK